MVGLVGGVDPLVGLHELVVLVTRLVVQPQGVGLRVRVDVRAVGVALAAPAIDDRDAALGPHHVLHEVGHLAHHWAPAGLVPADGAVVEGHLELAVVVHAGLELLGQPRPDGGDADRARPGHLAHDVHVVHAAVHDRRDGVHQGLVRAPVLPAALLIEVHAHDQGLPQGLSQLGEAGPGGVHAQDVAHHHLEPLRGRQLHELLGLLVGLGQRLLDEDVAAGLEGRLAEVVVGVRVGVDRDRVRPGGLDGLPSVPEGRDPAELLAQGLAAGRAAADQPHQLERFEGLVGARVGGAHVAAADDEDSGRAHAGSLVALPPPGAALEAIPCPIRGGRGEPPA